MTAFEQFIAQEYGRKEGDDIDDIYDEARARWRQMQSMPVDDNARAAQGLFASLPENPPLPERAAVDITRQQGADLRTPPAESYDGSFDLLTPADRTLFDDLPDSGGLRQDQAREMEIAQRQASGAEEGASAQPQGLPSDLVHQVWRMFADDYRDFTVRTDGPMKSEMRQNLVDDYTRGFAENYAPVLGVTLAEAQAIADNARKENRPIQPSDWMGGSTTAPQQDIETVGKVVTAANTLAQMGRKADSDALLQRFNVTQPNTDLSTALTLLDENAQLEQASRLGSWTAPDGSTLGEDDIEAKLAENQTKLVGLRPRLASTPSQDGVVLNINEFARNYIQKSGDKETVNISGINRGVAELAEKNPNLLVISQSGELIPASTFKYELPAPAEEAAPPEEKTTPELENLATGVGRAARSVVPIAAPVAQTYLKTYLNVLENLPAARAMREAEVLKKAVPYARGAISSFKRGFSEQ